MCPYRDDDRVCRLDRRQNPREELWEDRIVYWVVSCSFAKHASTTVIACEIEENLGPNRDLRTGGLPVGCPSVHTAVTFSTCCTAGSRTVKGTEERREMWPPRDKWQCAGSERQDLRVLCDKRSETAVTVQCAAVHLPALFSAQISPSAPYWETRSAWFPEILNTNYCSVYFKLYTFKETVRLNGKELIAISVCYEFFIKSSWIC
jgi:hypothetical protein